MLSSVFRIKLPDISCSPVHKDLLRSFEVQRPFKSFQAAPWDLAKILDSLRKSPFVPLSFASFRDITKKVLFLVAIATAKRVGELQALSRRVAFRGKDLVVSYSLWFMAKTESVRNPIPRFFLIKFWRILPLISGFASLPC